MNTEHESTKNPEVPPSQEADAANTKITELEKRLAALEDIVRAVRIFVRMPYGRFAHLDGYELGSARELTFIGGKLVKSKDAQ